jgi:hypothetical protein
VPSKQNKCCCCFGCINNGSLVPECPFCSDPGTGTVVGTGSGSGGEVPLRYEALIDWACCELQPGLIMIATNSEVSGACTWKATFTCILDPLITGKVVLTISGTDLEQTSLEIWFDETETDPHLRYVNGAPWRCLCANLMYIDDPYMREHPLPGFCPNPDSLVCVYPVGDCCHEERGLSNPMPRSLTATIVEEEGCPIADGTEISLTWNPTEYHYEGGGVTVGDCEIRTVIMRCTNFLSGSSASWDMDLVWFRPGIGEITVTHWPATEPPLYESSCLPFNTKFTEILNSFPCCPDPLSPPTGVAPRASIVVTE